MKRLFLPSLLLTACLSCSYHVPVLQFNPVLDSVYHYVSETGWQQSQSNYSDSMWNSTTIRFSLQCLQKDDSLRTMKLIFEGLKVMEPVLETTASKDKVIITVVKGKKDTINTDSNPPVYSDRAKDASLNPMHHILYRALIGDSVYILMDKQGKVVQIKGIEALVDRVVHKTQVEKSIAKITLRTFASQEAIQDMLNQVFFFMPNREISIDDNWIKNFVLTSEGPLKYSNLVNVDQIRGDSVILLYITSSISAKTGEGGRLYEQGKQTGKMVVDSSGMVWSYFAESTTAYQTDRYTVTKKHLLNVRRTKH